LTVPTAAGHSRRSALLRGVSASGQLFQVLRNPNFRRLWLTSLVGTVTMWTIQVANGYVAFTLTGSALALGSIALAQAIPQVLLAPVGGVLADRFDKRWLVLVGQFLISVSSLLVGVLLVSGQLQFWHLVAAALIQGIGFPIYLPANLGWMPTIARRDELQNALALQNLGINAGRIVGPSIAGALIAVPWFGVTGVYFLRLISFAWICWLISRVTVSGKPDSSAPRRQFASEIVFGGRYVFGRPALSFLFAYALVISLLGQAYQQVLPAFALAVFGVGSEGLGVMLSVVGVGAVAGSLAVGAASRMSRKPRLQTVTGVVVGLATITFGLAGWVGQFPLALVALFAIGLALSFTITLNNTLVLLNTDRQFYGRVSSLYFITQTGAQLGAFLAGASMDRIGGATTFISIGLAIVVLIVAGARLAPGYRQVRDAAA
jgi:MFS family permease